MLFLYVLFGNMIDGDRIDNGMLDFVYFIKLILRFFVISAHRLLLSPFFLFKP